MVAIVVCSNRVDELPETQLWSSDRVGLTALAEFAPGHRIVFAWDGPSVPDGLPATVEAAELPRHLSLWEARQWVLRELLTIGDDDEPVMLVDRDVVITPDTLSVILEDWASITLGGANAPGLLVCRSNHAPPSQDVRVGRGAGYIGGGHGFVNETELVTRVVVEVNAALLRRDVLDAMTPPWFDDMSDEVVAIDLGRAGLMNVVSRAYVHRHPRQRLVLGASDDATLTDRGIEFLRACRPDLVEFIEGDPTDCPAPDRAMELDWPDEAYRRWRAQSDSRARTVGMARCLRWLGRSVEAVQLMSTFDPTTFTDDELELAADLARLVGDLEAASSLYAMRPERFARADRELAGLVARYHALCADTD